MAFDENSHRNCRRAYDVRSNRHLTDFRSLPVAVETASHSSGLFTERQPPNMLDVCAIQKEELDTTTKGGLLKL